MKDVLIGYEVGGGAPVTARLQHLAVTGQTQQSGKTTTLEAMVTRAGCAALTFVTKRGEASFAGGRRITPYFRDRADWQFVDNLLSATLQEKNKFLRPWIMKICRATRTLADVHDKVREALATAKGINEGVYTQLDAYLDMIVPEIERADLADALDLRQGVNVMDVSGFAAPMQMLFVQSALDWINERCRDTVVVVPEAWEFVPEGRGSPVKASAVALVRKGAGIGNYIWVDSQDMAGVDKTILRGCTTWLIGVQREANEIKRSLANIPAGIKKPTAADVATLERGQFFVCWGRHCVKTYVRPIWLSEESAREVAMGTAVGDAVKMAGAPRRSSPSSKEEQNVKQSEADRLIAENIDLKREVQKLSATISRLTRGEARPADPGAAAAPVDVDAIVARLREVAAEDPVLLRVLAQRPEIEVSVQKKVIKMDGSTVPGRLAILISEGWFDEPRTGNAAFEELKRRGASVAKPGVYLQCDKLAEMGFLFKELPAGYRANDGMKVNVVEERAR